MLNVVSPGVAQPDTVLYAYRVYTKGVSSSGGSASVWPGATFTNVISNSVPVRSTYTSKYVGPSTLKPASTRRKVVEPVSG